MARRNVIRASDTERDVVAERLRHAATEGRILASELEQRLALALRARTLGELDGLVADLPGRGTGARHASSGSLPSVRTAATVAAVTVAVLCVLAVALVILAGLFAAWAVWALVAWWAFGHRRARHWHRRGPGGRCGGQAPLGAPRRGLL